MTSSDNKADDQKVPIKLRHGNYRYGSASEIKPRVSYRTMFDDCIGPDRDIDDIYIDQPKLKFRFGSEAIDLEVITPQQLAKSSPRLTSSNKNPEKYIRLNVDEYNMVSKNHVFTKTNVLSKYFQQACKMIGKEASERIEESMSFDPSKKPIFNSDMPRFYNVWSKISNIIRNCGHLTEDNIAQCNTFLILVQDINTKPLELEITDYELAILTLWFYTQIYEDLSGAVQ
jgi:hypothetical protein